MRTLYFLCLICIINPAYAQVNASVADSLYQAGAYSEVIPFYRSAADSDSTNVQAWYRLGYSLREAGDLDAAMEIFEEMHTRQSVPAPLIQVELARIYAAQGDSESAIGLLEKAAAAGYSNVRGVDSASQFNSIRETPEFVAARAMVDRNARPCAYADGYKEFDFWVGDWTVQAGGVYAGDNSITKLESDCLILEKWAGASGSTGTSMNYYDPVDSTWNQLWVSGGGLVIKITGGMEDSSMVLTGVVNYVNGTSFPFRGTWTPLTDGRVRQFFEQSNDEGVTWTPWFEGFYSRTDAQE